MNLYYLSKVCVMRESGEIPINNTYTYISRFNIKLLE